MFEQSSKSQRIFFSRLLKVAIYTLSFVVIASTLLYITIIAFSFFIVGTDYISYLTGGSIVKAGLGSKIYDLNIQLDYQLNAIRPYVRDNVLPFKSLPFVALLFVPFSFFSVVSGYIIFVALNFLLLFYLTRYLAYVFPKIKKYFFWYLIPFTYLAALNVVVVGQISFVLLFLFLYIYKLLKENRNYLLGFVAGFLIIKPQYLIAIPYLLILAKNKKRFVSGVAFSFFILFLLNLSIAGIGALTQFLPFILSTETSFFGSHVEQMITASSSLLVFLKPLGISYQTSLFINLFLYLASVALFYIKKSKLSEQYLFLLMLLFTLLFAVHVNMHDLSILVIGIFMLLNEAFIKKGLEKKIVYFAALVLYLLPLIIQRLNPAIGTFIFVLIIAYLLYSKKHLKLISLKKLVGNKYLHRS